MKLSDLDFRPHVTREIFIGVLNPDDGVVVPVEEWEKREDQARAQFVVVIDKTQRLGLIINKTFTLISKNRINNARICHGNGPHLNADNENV